MESKMMTDAQGVISGASNSVGRQFGGYTTPADISQEMWMWVLKHEHKVLEWLDREDKIDWAKGMKALSKTLTRVGVSYARKEKAAICGYRIGDEYFYTRTLVAALLVARENHGKMIVNQVDDTPRKAKLDSEGNDLLAMLSDVEIALDSLDEDQRQLVTDVCGRDVLPAAYAIEDGVTRQAVENRVNRALDRMIRVLGGEYPY
jgi:DNA-directed RNA polymerase specialized sigma24 family protein